MNPQVRRLPERRFAVRSHRGDASSVEDTRRPMYQHMIMHELVGGPPVLRFLARSEGDHALDVLVGATCGFDGDDEVRVEVLPEGDYAVLDYEGPEDGLPSARERLLEWVEAQGLRATGDVLQVHLMDTIDGVAEQELQVAVSDS